MRFRPAALLASGVLVASSACSMDATAPSSLTAPARAAMSSSASGNGHAREAAVEHLAYAHSDSYVVRIDPKQPNLLHFGPHTLDIPANAICDERSGYGILSFDLSCRAEKQRVQITATVRSTANGVPRLDLYPAMRFDPALVVTLRLYVPRLAAMSSAPRILYCETPTTVRCVDEAQLDPTLTPAIDLASNTLFRRIKHFSGYFVEW